MLIMRAITLFLVFSLLFPVCSGAVSKKQNGKNTGYARPELTTHTPGYCIFGGQSGRPYFGAGNFRFNIWKNDIIIAGDSGKIQNSAPRIMMLDALIMNKGNRIIVGFGNLESALQDEIDKFLAGKLSSEDFIKFLNENGADTAVLPEMEYIKKNNLKAKALYPGVATVDKLLTSGLSNLNFSEDKYLPAGFRQTDNKAFDNYIKEKFYPGDKNKEQALPGNYLLAVDAIDNIAAGKMTEALTENQGYKGIIFTDNGFMVYAKMSNIFKKIMPDRSVVNFYLTGSGDCPPGIKEEDKDKAGYIWYIKDSENLPETTEE